MMERENECDYVQLNL